MSNFVFETNFVKLVDLEQCPILLSINSLKKIDKLEKIAQSNSTLLPPLDIAVLPNSKKYVVKDHSVYNALRRAGINQFNAHFHFVNNITEVITLHARLSQSNPISPLAILELRDYLVKNGFNVHEISKTCCLDPIYEKLLSCVISPEAKNQLDIFLNKLSLKLHQVNMPSYIIEIISKRPYEIQADIVKSIFESVNDDTILNDRDFVFPNPDQVRMYANLHKKSVIKDGMHFVAEHQIDQNHRHSEHNESSYINTSKMSTIRKSNNVIVENMPHMAIMAVGKKKYRLNWKNKTYAEIDEKNDEFIVIHNVEQFQQLFALSSESIKFLKLDDDKIYSTTITDANQLRNVADKLDSKSKFNVILLSNKNIL